jgi:hypothetical protein
MHEKGYPLPVTKGFDAAYRQAWDIAVKKLTGTADLNALCRMSGAVLANEPGQEALLLNYLHQPCKVILSEVEVVPCGEVSLTPRDKLLILHYLNTADGSPSAGIPATFKELPDGIVYYPTYVKRAIKPLIDRFADNPEAMINAAGTLGGTKADAGEYSFRFAAFPRVNLTLTLWPGDEELPTEGNILFDSSITHFLPTEDITVLCEILAWKLVRAG